jgi:glyoxylase-like metal-dependent hydrolase (beta-lactamase superfamily II)
MRPQHILDNVHYIPGASNVGLVIGDAQQAVLIDSGPGQRSGRQILEMLKERDLSLAAILVTHGHGDHVGGNAYLVQHTAARVYAPAYDAVVMADPIWGTVCTFGGAEPIDELRIPRFAPEPCPADMIVAEGHINVADIPVQVVPLPGHTASHVGYIVGDVFFTGDILAGYAELAGAPVSYAYSIGMRLESLARLRRYSCSWYVPGHGPAQQDIADLVNLNIAQVHRMLDTILACLDQGPAEASEIMVAMCGSLGVAVKDIKHYYLVYPTLYAALSYLSNSGEIRNEVQANRLLWSRAKGSPC